MDRRFDSVDFARERQRDAAVQRLARTAGEAWYRSATVAPLYEPAPDGHVATLSAEQAAAEMYRVAVEIRLELIYCLTIDGELRKRWANRLGEIKLRSPAAIAEVDCLRKELGFYGHDVGDAFELDLGEISDRLWRLRQLCWRHQQDMQARKSAAPR